MKSLMLAASTDGKGLDYPVYASPKYDGVRCVVLGGKVFSRNFKLIPNMHVQSLFGHARLEGVDGELIFGDPRSADVFRNTTSAVMSKDGKPDVKLYAFDVANMGGFPFAVRRPTIGLRTTGTKNVHQVEHRLIKSEEELFEFEAWAVDQGYEGIMLNSVDGLYKQGRSTENEGFLLKMKRFLDSEAKIVGVEELFHNTNVKVAGDARRSSKKEGLVPADTLGALIVQDVKTKVEFGLGSGFSSEERDALWKNRSGLNGKVVKYKFFPSGSKDKPRFPTFQGFRSRIDF